jgi:16S rRNA (uracil1498-N3)-methyltransferase
VSPAIDFFVVITPRIFVGDDVHALADGAEYALPAAAARHVAQALRMRVGQPLALFTGAGGEYAAAIERIDRRDVVVRVERHDAIERESVHAVTLVQSVIAADMMDWVVRKAVELGAAAIAPIRSARSQGVSSEREERRAAHWRQIVVAACEQCGRNRLPGVLPLASFDAWLAGVQRGGDAVLLDAGAQRSLAAQAAVAAPRHVVIGPEGGFTADELAHAEAAGMTRVHAGPRVLRAETAALVALATLNAAAGDAR